MNGVSFYKEKLTDGKAVYFTQDNFNIKNDGTEDVSVQLQEAIHAVVKQDGYGVLFVPEGKYLLSRTIYVPKAVRIIGYGKNRPEFILQDNADGFISILMLSQEWQVFTMLETKWKIFSLMVENMASLLQSVLRAGLLLWLM